jgi:hypothetical protein
VPAGAVEARRAVQGSAGPAESEPPTLAGTSGAPGVNKAHVILIGLGKRAWSGALESWQNRNGSVDVQPVYEGEGVALYTSKSVALSGEVMLSDTLGRYRQNLSKVATVSLYRGEIAG